MIDLYYWVTPNGCKISIMLLGAGDQFRPELAERVGLAWHSQK